MNGLLGSKSNISSDSDILHLTSRVVLVHYRAHLSLPNPSMAHTSTTTPAAPGLAQPAPYRDEPESSPPPYPSSERQPPPQLFYHINQQGDAPPDYNFYDVERGSLVDIVLSQYAQSIRPGMANEESPPYPSPVLRPIRNCLVYCLAMLCGATFALFWICAIGYAIVVSFQKVADGFV